MSDAQQQVLAAMQDIEALIAEMTPERIVNAWLVNEDVPTLTHQQLAALYALFERYAGLRGGAPREHAKG